MKTAGLAELVVLIGLIVLLIGGTRIVLLRYKRIPVRVASGSMAPQLFGPHISATCPDCGIAVRCSLEHLPSRPFVCGNCGCDSFDEKQFAEQIGQRAYVDRQFRPIESLKRWQLVVFADPEDRSRLAVKRLIGLPGEAVSIEGGDVFVNDERLEKSLAEFIEIAIAVHDDRFQPPQETGAANRWQRNQPNGPLIYHHRRCYSSAGDPRESAPIYDVYEANQSLSRKPHEVFDIGCTFNVERAGGESLEFTFRQLNPPCIVRLDWKRRQIIARMGESVFVERAFPATLAMKRFALTIAWCDERLLIGVNNKPVVEARPASPAFTTQSTNTPLSLNFSSNKFHVSDLRVFRDVCYLPPTGFAEPWQRNDPLEDDEIFVLGDNAPDSRDGRFWQARSLRQQHIVGRVMP